MWACETGVFVNAWRQNGEMLSSDCGSRLAVFAAMSVFFDSSIQVVAICAVLFVFCVFDAVCIVFFHWFRTQASICADLNI